MFCNIFSKSIAWIWDMDHFLIATYLLYIYIYRVSQDECARLRESVP